MTGIESHDHMLIDVAWHRFAAKFPIDTKGMQKCCIEQLKLLHYLQKFCCSNNYFNCLYMEMTEQIISKREGDEQL